jgi:hypothetical protein
VSGVAQAGLSGPNFRHQIPGGYLVSASGWAGAASAPRGCGRCPTPYTPPLVDPRRFGVLDALALRLARPLLGGLLLALRLVLGLRLGLLSRLLSLRGPLLGLRLGGGLLLRLPLVPGPLLAVALRLGPSPSPPAPAP